MPGKPTLLSATVTMEGHAFAHAVESRRLFGLPGFDYDKVIAGHGGPIPFFVGDPAIASGGRSVRQSSPTLKLPDGTVIRHSRATLPGCVASLTAAETSWR